MLNMWTLTINRGRRASDKDSMTLLDCTFFYNAPLGYSQAIALDQARRIYGIRNLLISEEDHSIRVEYDSSRLRETDIEAILRDAAIQLCSLHEVVRAS